MPSPPFASSPQIVPLTSAPNQALAVTLAINGGSTTLSINQYWNRIGQFWAFDIYDAQGNPLVTSIPLITGGWPSANILAAYEYLQIGQAFVINQNGASTDSPNSVNLGAGFVLLWDSNVGSGSEPQIALPSVAGSGDWSSYNVNTLKTVFG